MKKKMAILLIVVLCANGSWAAIGDIWDLSDVNDGVWASIDPTNLSEPNTANPVTVGDATWRFHATSQGTPHVRDTFPFPTVDWFFPELPQEGVGWLPVTPGGDGWHICMGRYASATGSSTNFKEGEVGGHAPAGVTWTTLTGGTFRIDCGAWSARTLSNGRWNRLKLTVAGVERYSKIVCDGLPDPGGTPFPECEGVSYVGSENALRPPSIVAVLNPNDTVNLDQIGVNGATWAGYILIIEEIDAEAGQLTINANPAVVDTVTPFVNTTGAVPVAVPIEIEASRYVNCDADDVYEFDHWEVVANATIDNLTEPLTNVTVLTDLEVAEITAVYNDDRTCGEDCYPVPLADVSTPPDCKTDLDDLRVLAEAWLSDVSPQ